MKKSKSLLSIFSAFILLVGMLSLLSACNNDASDGDLVPEEKVVYYSEFGAKGDGVTDDFAAICATHDYANQNGVAVAADSGATYYIGGDDTMKEHIHRKSAVIKTNTYWRDAKFIIDDRGITNGQVMFKSVFAAESDTPDTDIPVPQNYTLAKGATNVGLTFEKPVLLYIVNANKNDFIRLGNRRRADCHLRRELYHRCQRLQV